MAYIDKLRAKEHLEQDILNLIRAFEQKTGYRVSGIYPHTITFQNSEGQVQPYINSLGISITPRIK